MVLHGKVFFNITFGVAVAFGFFISFYSPKSIQVHQSIVLPLCHNLLDGAIPLLQEDPVLIFPETSVTVLKAVVDYLYSGRALLAKIQDWKEVYTILGNLGVPLSDSVRTLF